MPCVIPNFLSQDILTTQQVQNKVFHLTNIILAIQDNQSTMQFLACLRLLWNHV